MKRCKACNEEFEDKFSFCPVDATPLNLLAKQVTACWPKIEMQDEMQSLVSDNCSPSSSTQCRETFRPTLIDNTALPARLVAELGLVLNQLKEEWPAIRRDPIAFFRRAVVAGSLWIRTLMTPPARAGIVTALAVVLGAGMIVLIAGRAVSQSKDAATNHDGDERAQIVTFLPVVQNENESGIGAGSNGRVGFAKGRGEGSEPQPRKATGGGGGGNHDSFPAQQGRLPPPSIIPAPIPKLPTAKTQLPVAGIDIDPALWTNLPLAKFGDPRSRSMLSSNGPGSGGGMGTVNGTGIGEGDGPGIGPGQGGNTGGGPKGVPGGGGVGGSNGENPDPPDHVYPSAQVTERARVISKPEPQYTEEARRNQVTGSVVLRAVFSRSGHVVNIHAIHALPFGLTEKAIAAARMIRFHPATKDGRTVNVYMQLEYNFNLY